MKDSWKKTIAAIGLAVPMIGCAGLNDWHYEKTQHLRAVSAYKSCGNPCNSCFPKDYRRGWVDGYYAGLTGDGCCPPAIAPATYWSPKQQLESRDNRRHEYYSGWQDGAAAASRCPDTHFLKVWESCDCPMPKCEDGCGSAGGCPAGQCSCGTCGSTGGTYLPMASGDGQMIEIISDVPWGTAHSPSNSVADDDAYGDDIREDTEVDSESVPEAPADPDSGSDAKIGNSDPLDVSISRRTSVQKVSFTLPKNHSAMPSSPADLFERWDAPSND